MIFQNKNPVKSFEVLLDKYWENQEVKYDYNEEIKVRTGSHKKKFIVIINLHMVTVFILSQITGIPAEVWYP
jgi:hypothetical protein